MTTTHLEAVFAGVPKALEDAGMADAAKALKHLGKLSNPYNLERAVAVLGPLGPELVEAYVRAGDFIKKASPAIRKDAVQYQRDLFTARCHVAAAREAARRALRGDTRLN